MFDFSNRNTKQKAGTLTNYDSDTKKKMSPLEAFSESMKNTIINHRKEIESRQK